MFLHENIDKFRLEKFFLDVHRQQNVATIAVGRPHEANGLVVEDLHFVENFVLDQALHDGPSDVAEELAGVHVFVGGGDYVAVIVEQITDHGVVATMLGAAAAVPALGSDVQELALQRWKSELEPYDGCCSFGRRVCWKKNEIIGMAGKINLLNVNIVIIFCKTCEMSSFKF